MPNPWGTTTGPGNGNPADPYKAQKATNAAQQVQGLYQRYLGRTGASDEAWAPGGKEYNIHLQGIGFTGNADTDLLSTDQYNTIRNSILASDEYKNKSDLFGDRPEDWMSGGYSGLADGHYLANAGTQRWLTPAGTPVTPTTPAGTGNTPTVADGLTQNVGYGDPIEGTVQGPQAIANDGLADQETTTQGLQQQTRDAIINMLDQDLPSQDDPIIAAQTSAFNAAQQRAAARQIAANAEAFGAQGLESSGARLSADNRVMSDQGLAEGTFASGLIGRELQDRRAQVMEALKIAQATTDQDLSRRLQEHLAQIDAAIRREATNVQRDLGEADLNLRGDLGRGNLNLGLLNLLQNGQQFNDRLGFDIASLEAALNNSALVRLLS